MTIRVAADGSALGNPGPAGWAWYVNDGCWAAGGWKHATNNQGELMAVLQFFRATAHLDDDLLILCDSQYVINCVTKWMSGWKKKGWRKADGKPVMNVELLKEIDEAIVGRKYTFEWVKGHANHPLNEAADSRARAASEAFQRGLPVDSGPGWVRDGDADTAAPVVAWAPVAEPVAAPAPERAPAPSLFDFDEPDEPATVTVTARLTPQQHERLLALASREGVSVEQALAGLV
ncbi:ribonuclease HI [Conyzicola lurida]|uniref:ribonuclease H n=1 Tax=Conyzicola lurida TaxID=1172621 RepID=A0A841ADX1_9MICO|nr:ribonuclease H [Conyzicola lurida]MBB5841920.1 ribonuclease HI [Conyzicola lurida]